MTKKSAKRGMVFVFTLLAVMAVLGVVSAEYTDLKINEFSANPSSGDDWVEIYYPEILSGDVNLGGCTLINSTSSIGRGEIPLSGTISPGSHKAFDLNNFLGSDGWTIMLYCHGVIVDEISYSNNQQLYSFNEQTTGRCPNGIDTNNIDDFQMTYSTKGEPNMCGGPLCGNSILDEGEECDLGDNNGVMCTPEYGESCTYCTNLCESTIIGVGEYCGDRIVNGREQCDDGNTQNGDGCSKSCRRESSTGGDGGSVGIGVEVGTEDFVPQVWMCDNRIVWDDNTEPGRLHDERWLQECLQFSSYKVCKEALYERMNNYAFEGESIAFNVLVFDKNGIEKIEDVFITLGDVQGEGNDIEANCVIDDLIHDYDQVDQSCNARILEEELDSFADNTAAYYTCILTVETPDSMYGEYWVTVEALDLDGLSGTMDENEYWFFNPEIALGIDGDLVFEDVRPGTSSYSDTLLISNEADDGSGVRLDMFISGTDFYDSSSSGARCPISNVLDLDNFGYFATKGGYSSRGDPRADSEGYVPINYGIGFNDPDVFYFSHEIMQSGPLNGPYWQSNILSPGADVALTFKLNLPEPCNGDFDSGQIYFWGEAI